MIKNFKKKVRNSLCKIIYEGEKTGLQIKYNVQNCLTENKILLIQVFFIITSLFNVLIYWKPKNISTSREEKRQEKGFSWIKSFLYKHWRGVWPKMSLH